MTFFNYRVRVFLLLFLSTFLLGCSDTESSVFDPDTLRSEINPDYSSEVGVEILSGGMKEGVKHEKWRGAEFVIKNTKDAPLDWAELVIFSMSSDGIRQGNGTCRVNDFPPKMKAKCKMNLVDLADYYEIRKIKVMREGAASPQEVYVKIPVE